VALVGVLEAILDCSGFWGQQLNDLIDAQSAFAAADIVHQLANLELVDAHRGPPVRQPSFRYRPPPSRLLVKGISENAEQRHRLCAFFVENLIERISKDGVTIAKAYRTAPEPERTGRA
jgi:hypothetical protein